MKNQVIFIYDHYYPAYGAGGPITSLSNLGHLINEEVELKILTSSYEYKSNSKLTSVKIDSWTSCMALPVWYASNWRSVRLALETLCSDRSTTLYLNGIFSWKYFLIPLLLSYRLGFKVIISPRGMLQAGAIKTKRTKKEIYLFFLKLSGLLSKATWHATDEQERADIESKITKEKKITVIPDVPLVFKTPNIFLKKVPDKLSLVYFSLIAEKKNLLFILEILNKPDFSTIQLDIIGPIKDESYWDRCKDFISGMLNPERICYKGKIQPDDVPKVLPDYHALVLPTHGENYGHVIIEMLACWRPVLISNNTPWNDLSEYEAGKALVLNNDVWEKEIHKMLLWDQEDFERASIAASHYYKLKIDHHKLKTQYLELFA